MLDTNEFITFCLLVCRLKTLRVKKHKTISFSVVPYECETWSLTLREDYRMWVFEDRLLRRIFGLKMEGILGSSRKLHTE
jgi:hypothetical protein